MGARSLVVLVGSLGSISANDAERGFCNQGPVFIIGFY
jgi:hypothetical protein